MPPLQRDTCGETRSYRQEESQGKATRKTPVSIQKYHSFPLTDSTVRTGTSVANIKSHSSVTDSDVMNTVTGLRGPLPGKRWVKIIPLKRIHACQ
jgi:hypothetical protein